MLPCVLCLSFARLRSFRVGGLLALVLATSAVLATSGCANGMFSGAIGTAATPAVATTTTLAVSATTAQVGSSVTLTATVSPSSASGSVSFYDGGILLGAVPVSNGTAAITVTLAQGAHTVQAGLGGTAGFLGSLSGQIAITITPVPLAATTTTLTTSATAAKAGTAVTFSATVSSTAITGVVAFFDGTTQIGTGSVSSGVATLTTGGLAVGGHSITATFMGSSVYAASTSNIVVLTTS